jgi:hypothetical protein
LFKSLGKLSHQSLVDGLDEVMGVQVGVSLYAVGVVHADGQIFGHLSLLHCLDGGSLESVAELLQFSVLVELGSVEETSGPGVDAGNGVGGCLSSLLVLSVVTSHSAVGSLSLNSTVGSVQHGSHQSQRSIS